MQRHLPTTLLTLIVGGFVSPLLQAQSFADAGGELLHNDNLGRFIKDGVSDTGVTAALTAGYHWQPWLYTSINATGTLRKTVWERYSGMNSLAASAGLDLSHKFGIGELRPVLRTGVQVERQSFGNDLRDTTLTTSFLGVSKRLTSQLSIDLRLTHERSDGDHNTPLPAMAMPEWPPKPPKSGKAWDFSVNALRISAEYELGPSAWLGTAFQFRDGPVVATAAVYSQPNPSALASTYDPVFGPHAVAYQLDARTRVFSIDYNHALFERATAYAGYEFQYSTASSGLDYQVRLLRVGFIHGF
jgi:hypothetical protein